MPWQLREPQLLHGQLQHIRGLSKWRISVTVGNGWKLRFPNQTLLIVIVTVGSSDCCSSCCYYAATFLRVGAVVIFILKFMPWPSSWLIEVVNYDMSSIITTLLAAYITAAKLPSHSISFAFAAGCFNNAFINVVSIWVHIYYFRIILF